MGGTCSRREWGQDQRRSQFRLECKYSSSMLLCRVCHSLLALEHGLELPRMAQATSLPCQNLHLTWAPR